jgi:hypothetical protein
MSPIEKGHAIKILFYEWLKSKNNLEHFFFYYLNHHALYNVLQNENNRNIGITPS